MNCLNKNVITHIDILRRKKGVTFKLWSIDRVLNKEHIYGKFM